MVVRVVYTHAYMYQCIHKAVVIMANVVYYIIVVYALVYSKVILTDYTRIFAVNKSGPMTYLL